MNRKGNPLLAVIATVVFAASMLSNCYCAPAQESLSSKKEMAPPCHQTAEKETNKDCAPRFQTDSFENATNIAKTIQPLSARDVVLISSVSLISEKAFEFDVPFESPPVSPPDFFVLHHAFLI